MYFYFYVFLIYIYTGKELVKKIKLPFNSDKVKLAIKTFSIFINFSLFCTELSRLYQVYFGNAFPDILMEEFISSFNAWHLTFEKHISLIFIFTRLLLDLCHCFVMASLPMKLHLLLIVIPMLMMLHKCELCYVEKDVLLRYNKRYFLQLTFKK